MRQVAKTVSNKPVEFIPDNQKEFSKTATNISERPLIFMVRKLTREDWLNLAGIEKVVKEERNGETTHRILNLAETYRYIFENCVVEMKNVLLQDGDKVKELESLKGEEKNQLWGADGLDGDIFSACYYVQTISSLDNTETKN